MSITADSQPEKWNKTITNYYLSYQRYYKITQSKLYHHKNNFKFQCHKISQKSIDFCFLKWSSMKQHKYLPPKFSKICQPLKQLLGIKGEEFVQFPLNNDFRSSKTGFKNQYKKQQEKSNEKQLSHDKSANIELRTPKTIFYRPRTHKTQFDSKSQIRNRSTTNKSIARSQFYKQKTTQSMQKGKNNLMIHIEQPTMCRLNPKFSEQTTNSNKKQQMEKIYSNKNDLSKLNQSGQIRYRNKKAELMRKTFQSQKVMKNAKYQEKDNEQPYKRRGNMQVKVQFKQSYPKFNIKDELRKKYQKYSMNLSDNIFYLLKTQFNKKLYDNRLIFVLSDKKGFTDLFSQYFFQVFTCQLLKHFLFRSQNRRNPCHLWK